MSDAARAISIHVNGEPRSAPEGQPLLVFLDTLGLPPTGILVEHNGTALLRSEWEQTRLSAGDRLEILRVVAGG